MSSRTLFTFVAEPSLLKKDRKSKDILLSTALTHISRFKYDRNSNRKPSQKQRNSKQHPQYLQKPCEKHHTQCCFSGALCGPRCVAGRGLTKNHVLVPFSMQPTISTYISDTYKHKSTPRISRLCDYCRCDL